MTLPRVCTLSSVALSRAFTLSVATSHALDKSEDLALADPWHHGESRYLVSFLCLFHSGEAVGVGRQQEFCGRMGTDLRGIPGLLG